MRRTLRFGLLALYIVGLAASFFVTIKPGTANADFQQGNIIDDSVFDTLGGANVTSPNAIDNWLNQFPSSCISPNSGFRAPDVTGYNPTNSFSYGSDVTAGNIIYHAAHVYGLNPQVILSTMQKEESLVTGTSGCSILRYTAAMGYGCPDSGGGYNYSGFELYSINGSPVTSVSGTCVNSAHTAGFARQVIVATWQLKFDEQRAEGNYGWDVQLSNYPNAGNVWDNSDDPQTCYSHRVSQGYRQVSPSSCPNGSLTYYDGNTTIDGTTVTVSNGPTAALYNYTPHFSGNQNFVSIFEGWFGSTHGCDYSNGQGAPPPNAFGNGGAVTLAGHWTSSSTQGLLYATPNHSGGFDVGIMDSSPSSGLQWRGTWWSQTNGAIDLANTIFIPVNNSNGRTDLYYATSTNWSKPGFTVGLMANTGSGFVYEGSQWSPSSLSLANTRFIPGNWTSTTQGDFAYATPNHNGGFDVGVMDPSLSSGLQWRGTWWSQGNSSINLNDTTFIPADTNGDGYTDLYYASSTNWNVPGFSVGLMANTTGTGLAYQGNQWNNTSLSLSGIKFLPGNWTGGSNQGFAYTTQCGTRGFDLGVMSPSSSGLVWQGTWWDAQNLPYTSTAFIPADADGDGYTDLYYATPSGGGFSLALQHTNQVGGGFSWQGQQWAPASIPLNSVLFLP